MTTINSIRDLELYLDELMGSITTANGCLTDIGLAHYRGRRSLDRQNAPCVTTIEGPDEVPEMGPNTARVRQRFGFSAFLICDRDNPNDAGHDALEDILAVLFAGGKTLDGRVKEIAYVGHSMAPRPDGDDLMQVVVEVDISFSVTLTRK